MLLLLLLVLVMMMMLLKLVENNLIMKTLSPTPNLCYVCTRELQPYEYSSYSQS